LRRVTTRYTWERTAQGYEEVLNAIQREPLPSKSEPIPPFFTKPNQETDIGLDDLTQLYFAE
jgi:hypothetical protein